MSTPARACRRCGKPRKPDRMYCSQRCVSLSHQNAPDPTPDEIAAACDEIRAGWTDDVFAARSSQPPLPWHAPMTPDRRTLDTEFHRIQRAAGIHLPCPDSDEHECTPCCHVYGFHALRRSYATLNADTMPAVVLQRKMRHKSFTTTQQYIQLADKMKRATERVYEPGFLKAN